MMSDACVRGRQVGGKAPEGHTAGVKELQLPARWCNRMGCVWAALLRTRNKLWARLHGMYVYDQTEHRAEV